MNSVKRLIGALLTCPLMIAFAFYVGPAQAQQGADETEEIVVTGSRIRRDEYTSAAPIQTFDVEAARKNGIATIGELLQQSTITYGQQINGEQRLEVMNRDLLYIRDFSASLPKGGEEVEDNIYQKQ